MNWGDKEVQYSAGYLLKAAGHRCLHFKSSSRAAGQGSALERFTMLSTPHFFFQ